MFNSSTFTRLQILLLGCMGVLVEMSYMIFDNLSDTILVTNIGSEGLSFLRIFLLFPLILLTAKLYELFMNSLRKEIVLYVFMIMTAFMTLLYTYVLSPHSAALEMDKDKLDQLIATYPNFKVPLKIIGNWTSAFLYSVYILYVQTIYGLVLWKVASDVAIRKNLIFPIITAVTSCGGIIGSLIIKSINVKFPDWNQALGIYCGLLLVTYIFICTLYNSINLDFKRHTFFDKKTTEVKKKKSISFKETIKIIFEDNLVFFLTMTVTFCYAANLIELVWKNEVHMAYPTELDYSSFMANMHLILSGSFVLFGLLAIYTLKKWKWKTNASASTYLLLIFSILFFGTFHLIGTQINLWFIKFQLTPLLYVWMGALFMVIYPAVDNEMYFPAARKILDKIPPDQSESAQLGFELLGANAGTMIIAAFIQICLSFSSINGITPILGGVLVFLCVVRLYYIHKLGNKLKL